MSKTRRIFQWGGLAAACVLIAFGIASIVMGAQGRSTVHSSLSQERVVGTPDMTPTAIAAEVREAGLQGVSLPTCTVAGRLVDSGARARCFAQYMRIHALEQTGGYTYGQMGQFQAKAGTPKSALEPGGGTSDAKFAVVDPKTGQPTPNGARNVWVTETALTTALNASYMAEQTALFGVVVGVALLLAGIGFAVLDIATLAGGRVPRMRRAPAPSVPSTS